MNCVACNKEIPIGYAFCEDCINVSRNEIRLRDLLGISLMKPKTRMDEIEELNK